MAVDPVAGSTGNPQSLNRYTYALNNPMLFVDPRGEKPGYDRGRGMSGSLSVSDLDVGAEPGEDGARDPIRSRRAKADRENLKKKATIVAKRVFAKYNQRSIDNNKELGGLVFDWMDQVSNTTLKEGDECTSTKCEVDTWDQRVFLPPGARVIATLHMHAGPGDFGNAGGEAFSMDDALGYFTVGVIQATTHAGFLGGYLATPSGAIYFLSADAISRSEWMSLSRPAIEGLIRSRQEYLGRVGE